MTCHGYIVVEQTNVDSNEVETTNNGYVGMSILTFIHRFEGLKCTCNNTVKRSIF